MAGEFALCFKSVFFFNEAVRLFVNIFAMI